jgi:hypothetical protein
MTTPPNEYCGKRKNQLRLDHRGGNENTGRAILSDR